MLKHHYIIDTKLLFYSAKQTGRDVLDTFNDMARVLDGRPKGDIYLVADLGASEYRLGISAYYKGARREAKASKTPEELAEHEVFGTEYNNFIEVCKMLPVIVMDVSNVEADDTASILAFELAKDPSNRISLITRDGDWAHSIIDSDNVKMISPYFREADTYGIDIRRRYNVGTREEFTLKKTLEGDDGDSILRPKWLGEVKTDEIWESCIIHDVVTLELLRAEIHNFIGNQKNPNRFTVPAKYIEYNVASTIDEVIDINYKLAATMKHVTQLSDTQQAEYHNALQRPIGTEEFNAFDIGIGFFGRPITFSETARRVFNVKT